MTDFAFKKLEDEILNYTNKSFLMILANFYDAER
jgi:hypothetical protein